MPRRPRRTRNEADESLRMMLLKGFDFANEFTDREALRLLWQQHRTRLLTEWVAIHPGTRPWAWWQWDSPERRHRIDGVIHPFDDRKRNEEVERRAAEFPDFRETAYSLFYGCPRCLFTPDDFAAKYESELDYLDRLHLLTADERREWHR